MKNRLISISLLLASLPLYSLADSQLSDNLVIESKQLGYELQYRVYLPPAYEQLDRLPVIYITDGQWYIAGGQMVSVLDQEIESGRIEPVIAVFVDNRDPHNLADNRRNRQFFCNQQYADFYRNELIPHIDSQYKTQGSRDGRVILGLSFGGLNSACFALQADDSFVGIAMQSPANHPVTDLFDRYRAADNRDLKFFLSHGQPNDNTASTRAFYRLLQELEHDVTYYQVNEGHNWRNWQPLLDEVLLTFFATE